ncbi:MAG: phosphoribosylglycinamide formyltransferase [Balneolaceae bacterium]
MKKIAVFASGSGSNFQAVIDAVQSGRIEAVICGLITNRDNAGAIKRAEASGIPARVLNPSDFPDSSEYESTLLEQLKEWNPDLIVLAGYMLKIPDSLISAMPDQIINIHPALLPAYGGKGFYGLRVHKAVLDAGESETGCSVHYVNERYDDGPVIDQQKVRVLSDDTPETLRDRVLKAEHQLLPSVIAKLLNKT